MSESRPYPEGIAWDEAWRQRRRAERLELTASEVLKAACINDQVFVAGLRSTELESLRFALVKLQEVLSGWTE